MTEAIRCRRISSGTAEGEALVSSKPISFFGDVDPETGVVVGPDSDIRGLSVAGKVLVFPTGRGSTVGSYVLYGMARRGVAPAAIICEEADPVVAVGAVMAGVPMVDRPEKFDFKTGQYLRVRASDELIEVL